MDLASIQPINAGHDTTTENLMLTDTYPAPTFCFNLYFFLGSSFETSLTVGKKVYPVYVKLSSFYFNRILRILVFEELFRASFNM